MVAVGVFLSTMDSSMINIALPYIMEDFTTELTSVQWVVQSYLLMISASLLIWGKIADYCAKGSLYLSGMLIFSLGALSCSLAPNLFFLIGSRLVQGTGAAMMMATGAAIIRLVAPRDQLGRWLGSLGIATSIGLMSGPFFGGLILHTAGWRIIFIVYVPISLLVVLLGWIFLAGTLPKHSAKKISFDYGGAFFWALLVTCIVLLVSFAEKLSSVTVLLAIFALVALISFFYLLETARRDPFFPVVLLRQRYFSIAAIVVALSFAVLFFVLLLMPLYFKYVAGLGYDRIGYMMMAVPASLFIVSPLAGGLYDRLGGVYLTSLGLAVSGVAVVLLAQIDQDTSLVIITGGLALLGCGQSIFLSPNTASVLSQVAVEDTGVTAGVLATARNLGMLFGVALAGLLFSYFFQSFTGEMRLQNYEPGQAEQFLKAFRYTLIVAAIISFTSALLSLARR